MSKPLILRLSLDVSKIDKSALFSGKKGTYLNAAVFIKDEEDQYGNIAMVTQDLGVDRKGEKGPILGNAKWAKGYGPAAAAPAQAVEDQDEIPF